MPYYVAEGHSITSKRGVLGCDDPNPEVTPGCIGGDPKTADARLAELAGLGILVKADESPWHASENTEHEVFAARTGEAAEDAVKARGERKPKAKGDTDADPTGRKGLRKEQAAAADPLAAASAAAGKGKRGKGGATRSGA
jgi:hypothetical protein